MPTPTTGSVVEQLRWAIFECLGNRWTVLGAKAGDRITVLPACLGSEAPLLSSCAIRAAQLEGRFPLLVTDYND